MSDILKPGGKVCLCASCGQFFTGLYSFDKHLYYKKGAAAPSCRTPAQLLAKGWSQNVYGRWATAGSSEPHYTQQGGNEHEG
jgi:hypothetical protein